MFHIFQFVFAYRHQMRKTRENRTKNVFFFCLQICGFCKKSKQGTVYENSGFLMTGSSQLLLYFTSFFTIIGVRNKHDETNIRVKTDKRTKYCALLMLDKRNSRIYDFDFYFSLFLYFCVLFSLVIFRNFDFICQTFSWCLGIYTFMVSVAYIQDD